MQNPLGPENPIKAQCGDFYDVVIAVIKNVLEEGNQ